MSHQPMGVSGIDLDITTGRPRQVKTREEHQAQEELKEVKALQEAVQISQELPAVLPIVARQLENRILELMRADPQCLSILQMINAFKVKIDLGPHVAAKIRRQAMGVVLNSMTDETKVAPEGIPTEE
jgi:hypothetical protein